MTDLDQTVAKLATRRHGVVVATIIGDELQVRAAGDAGPGTRFEIGSVTKTFTALTLARLTLAGVTSLDEPLRDLLPDGVQVPSRDGQEITLRHLATHTSGLPRLPTGMLRDALLRPNSPDPYARCSEEFVLEALARTRLSAPPGRRFRYSNFGAGLLGLALARRAGMPYEALVIREINNPIGLRMTSIAGTVTQGFRKIGRPVGPWDLAALAGAGALRSTVDDMATFVRAQMNPASELASAVELALSVEHPVNVFLTARLGWMSHRLHERQGGRLHVFHNGETGGFASFVGFDPEARVGVVGLSDTRGSMDGAMFELLTSLHSQS